MTLKWKQEKIWNIPLGNVSWLLIISILQCQDAHKQIHTQRHTHTHTHTLYLPLFILSSALYLSLVCLCLFFLPHQYQVLIGNGKNSPQGLRVSFWAILWDSLDLGIYGIHDWSKELMTGWSEGRSGVYLVENSCFRAGVDKLFL